MGGAAEVPQSPPGAAASELRDGQFRRPVAVAAESEYRKARRPGPRTGIWLESPASYGCTRITWQQRIAPNNYPGPAAGVGATRQDDAQYRRS